LLDYALQVEKITTLKKSNLILNVDGAVAVCFVDLVRNCGAFTREEADQYMHLGVLNGIFVVGRSIGFIGHYLDQKRLKQDLYRYGSSLLTIHLLSIYLFIYLSVYLCTYFYLSICPSMYLSIYVCIYLFFYHMYLHALMGADIPGTTLHIHPNPSMISRNGSTLCDLTLQINEYITLQALYSLILKELNILNQS